MYGNLRVLAEEEEEEASGAGERTYCVYLLWQGFDRGDRQRHIVPPFK
jgi:hypothetical protein